tara:strand:+ start:346 stop:675 length:330 start_codon:yes stop_codon:yes gene_type:complete
MKKLITVTKYELPNVDMEISLKTRYRIPTNIDTKNIMLFISLISRKDVRTGIKEVNNNKRIKTNSLLSVLNSQTNNSSCHANAKPTKHATVRLLLSKKMVINIPNVKTV